MDGGGPKPQLCELWSTWPNVNSIIEVLRSIPRAHTRSPTGPVFCTLALLARRRLARVTHNNHLFLIHHHHIHINHAHFGTIPFSPIGSCTRTQERRERAGRRRPGDGRVAMGRWMVVLMVHVELRVQYAAGPASGLFGLSLSPRCRAVLRPCHAKWSVPLSPPSLRPAHAGV